MKIAIIATIFILLAGSALALGVLSGPYPSEAAAQATRDDPAFYNNLGYSLAQAGEGAGAQTAFAHAVALDPAYELARSNLATVAFANGDYTTAIAQLRWLVAQHPENKGYQFDLAQNLVSQARYADADKAKLEEGAAIYESLGDFPHAAENAAAVRNVIADVWA